MKLNKRKILTFALIIFISISSAVSFKYAFTPGYVFAGVDPWAHFRSATSEVGEYDEIAILNEILEKSGIDSSKLSANMKQTILNKFKKAFKDALNAQYGCGKQAKPLSELIKQDPATWMGAFERQIQANLEMELTKDLKSGTLTDYEKQMWEVYNKLAGFYVEPDEEKRQALLETREFSIKGNDYVFLSGSDVGSSNLTQIAQLIIGGSMNQLLQTPEAQKCLECMFKSLLRKCVIACVEAGGNASKCQKNCEKIFLSEFQKNNQNLSGYPKVVTSSGPSLSGQPITGTSQSTARPPISINASKTCTSTGCNVAVSASGIFSMRVWKILYHTSNGQISGSSLFGGVDTYQPPDGKITLNLSLDIKTANTFIIQATPIDGNKYSDNEVRVECLSCVGDNTIKNELDKGDELNNCGKDDSGKSWPHTVCYQESNCQGGVFYGCKIDYETCGYNQCDIINKANVQEICKAKMSGSTKTECGPLHTLCGNSCVDLAHDSKNCGKCGNICGTDTACYNGSCISVPAAGCTPNCTGKVCGSDGCSGSCGTCASDFSCTNGSCVSTSAGTTTYYSCDTSNWTCKEDKKGIYSTLDMCKSVCKKPVYYSCDSKTLTCVERWDGQFNSLSECNKACAPPPATPQ